MDYFHFTITLRLLCNFYSCVTDDQVLIESFTDLAVRYTAEVIKSSDFRSNEHGLYRLNFFYYYTECGEKNLFILLLSLDFHCY